MSAPGKKLTPRLKRTLRALQRLVRQQADFGLAELSHAAKLPGPADALQALRSLQQYGYAGQGKRVAIVHGWVPTGKVA